MNGLEISIISVLIIYVIGIVFILYGSISQKNLTFKKNDNAFTLIIPVKNESKNIQNCLQSIKKQNYNLNNVQILIMDDDSTDNSVILAETFKSLPNLSIHHVDQSTSLVGKANAIDQGVELADHDIILICDADCKPNPDWFTMIISQFDDDVGVVSGFTLLNENLIPNKLFGIMQTIDWIFLLGTGSGAVGVGYPISCIGSNLAFRKRAYEEVGGYKTLRFSITEDLSLYKAISRNTKWKFKFPLNDKSINWSIPMENFKQFYRQRKRWLFGSFDLNFFGGVLLSAAILIHTIPIFTYIGTDKDEISLITFSLVFTIDILVISRFSIALKQYHYIKYIPLYFLYYFFNVIILPFVLIFDHNVEWKNRRYTKKGLKQ